MGRDLCIGLWDFDDISFMGMRSAKERKSEAGFMENDRVFSVYRLWDFDITCCCLLSAGILSTARNLPTG
jgi:hypothetical protein